MGRMNLLPYSNLGVPILLSFTNSHTFYHPLVNFLIKPYDEFDLITLKF